MCPSRSYGTRGGLVKNQLNELLAGPRQLTVGYLPFNDIQRAKALTALGYRVSPSYEFGFNFIATNFHNPTVGPIFRQLYFRQAMQHLVNQKQWIKVFYHGYATPTYGPVPLQPPNHYADSYERSDPYPFDIRTTERLLSAHGWEAGTAGIRTCRRPGTGPTECGAGVARGASLSFNLGYSSGDSTIQGTMAALKSVASQAGIDLRISSIPFNTLFADSPACKSTQADCRWQMSTWGGWGYVPDYYPTGDEIFVGGAGGDPDNYANRVATSLITATYTAPGSASQATLDRYQNYMARELPVIYLPEPQGTLITGWPVVSARDLAGVSINPFGLLNPETWHFTRSR